MSVIASQITSLTIVYSTVYSRRRSKKTSKLRVTGLCVGNSPVTAEFPAQTTSNAENVSIWWSHHGFILPQWHSWDHEAQTTPPTWKLDFVMKNTYIAEWRDCSAHNTILIVGLTYYVGICLGCGIEYNYLCNNEHVQMHRNTPIPSSIKEMDSSCNASRTSTTLDTVCCIWFVFQIQAGIIFHAIRTQIFILSTHQQYLSYWANVLIVLIHRGWETLIYVSVNWANLGPENGLSPV